MAQIHVITSPIVFWTNPQLSSFWISPFNTSWSLLARLLVIGSFKTSSSWSLDSLQLGSSSIPFYVTSVGLHCFLHFFVDSSSWFSSFLIILWYVLSKSGVFNRTAKQLDNFNSCFDSVFFYYFILYLPCSVMVEIRFSFRLHL